MGDEFDGNCEKLEKDYIYCLFWFYVKAVRRGEWKVLERGEKRKEFRKYRMAERF